MTRKLRFFIAFTGLVTFCITGQARTYYQQFSALTFKTDSVQQLALLNKWQADDPNDPELYVCFFNYFVNKSTHELVSLDKRPGDNTSMEIQDSTGNTVGYIEDQVWMDPQNLTLAFSYIDEGIKAFPDRLDMRLGKIFILGKADSFASFTSELIEAAHHGHEIGNKWLWSENKEIDTPDKFFLTAVQDDINTLYTSGGNQVPMMRRVAEAVLRFYPKSVELLSDMAITYLYDGELDKALKYLLEAEKISPKDGVVLSNIAETYMRKKDKKKAIEYYKKVIATGDPELAESAKERLKDMK